ncbi:hypothetical protein ACM7YZ_01830 [Pseudomonas aeruginosa]
MSSVVDFVTAYRDLSRPALSGSSFDFSAGTYSPATSDSIALIRTSGAGRFDEFLIDGKEVDPNSFDFSTVWGSIGFTYKIDTSGNVPVFRNFDQLMARSKSFLRSEIPTHFYLVDDDILSSEEPIDERVSSLKAICKLIVYLADLAHFHDEKNSSDEYKLVFVAEDPAKGERAITLFPYLDKEILACKVGTELLDSLQTINLDNNPHLLKERSIFRASLIEYLSSQVGGRERFKMLVSTWDQFRSLYENNLSTYLSGFSFHKAKQEVATAQLTIADQMSKVVGDISGKILGVPVSLAVIVAIAKAGGVLESSILVLGIMLTSALIAETLAAQKLQYERIKHSRKIIFAAHEQRLSQYPEDLRGFLQEAIRGLSANERKLRRSLRTLRLVSWGPAIAAILVHAYLYRAELYMSWTSVQSTLVSFVSYIASYLF